MGTESSRRRARVVYSMRFTILAMLLAAASCGADGCAKQQTTTDAAVTLNQAQLVCYHLVTIGCDLGDMCPIILREHQGSTTDFHLDCLANANSTLQAEQCGSVRCRKY